MTIPSSPMRTRRGWPWWLLAIVLLAGASGAGYYWFYIATPSADAQKAAGAGVAGGPGGKGGPGGPGGRRQGFDPSRAMPVVAVPAKTADVGIYLAGLGAVTPLATVTVRSRVDGQLMKVLFKEGQTVKRGDLLAEIDPRAFQVQLAQAEGQMAKDQALLKNAQVDAERYRLLFQQDSVSKQQLDTQESLVRQYEGTVKADQGAIDNAKLQLDYSRITAPIGGRLGLRQVDVGNIVRSSDATGLVVITQLQPVTAVFTIPEDAVPAVMKKLKAGEKLTADAYDRADKLKLASGVLITADNQIDPATGTVKLKAQFANDDFALFPNQFVNVRLLVDVMRGATVIPSSAVQRGARGTFVYVVKADNTVTVRPVKLGPVQGELTAIDSGLEAQEVVVTDGTDKLREGAKVELPSRDAAADGARKGGRRDGAGRKDGAGKEGGWRKDGGGERKDGARKGGDGAGG
jgi:multidrug efflux system membrane fusion protein